MTESNLLRWVWFAVAAGTVVLVTVVHFTAAVLAVRQGV